MYELSNLTYGRQALHPRKYKIGLWDKELRISDFMGHLSPQKLLPLPKFTNFYRKHTK